MSILLDARKLHLDPLLENGKDPSPDLDDDDRAALLPLNDVDKHPALLASPRLCHICGKALALLSRHANKRQQLSSA